MNDLEASSTYLITYDLQLLCRLMMPTCSNGLQNETHPGESLGILPFGQLLSRKPVTISREVAFGIRLLKPSGTEEALRSFCQLSINIFGETGSKFENCDQLWAAVLAYNKLILSLRFCAQPTVLKRKGAEAINDKEETLSGMSKAYAVNWSPLVPHNLQLTNSWAIIPPILLPITWICLLETQPT